MFIQTCSICRAIRSVILCAGLTALLVSHQTGTLPEWVTGGDVWGRLLWVAVLWSLINVILNWGLLVRRRDK